ncbi:N(5)-(carboxyethyl)ornithine synthase [Clostridium perfringens]
MRTVGFLKSDKKNEKRVAVMLEDINKIKNKKNLFFEKGYYKEFNISDEMILNTGANVVEREEVLKKDIICDPKAGDGSYIEDLKEGTIVFGWIHAVQNKDITDKFLKNKLTAIAWEEMYEGGRHSFWRSNELAGEAAIIHSYSIYGKLPYETKVAILGRGNIARGALTTLVSLGANVEVYNRNMEELLRKNINDYDVIVNGVLWDTKRKDHIIYKNDLKKMKNDSMIIDISCDKNGAVETSIPTTIDNPVYYIENVLHYVVDHTPTILYKSASKSISKEVVKYIDLLIEDNMNNTLKKALIIDNGIIIDNKINEFQNRNII